MAVRAPAVAEPVVRCLIAEQFPEWTDLEIRPVSLDGWDNSTFRLGDDKSVRLPNADEYVPQIEKEHRWLPLLARHLPLPIPHPISKGRPGCGFSRPWSVYGWLDGEVATASRVTDLGQLATDLSRFLRELQAVTGAGGPLPGAHNFNRGGPIARLDDQTRVAIRRLSGEIDAHGALAVWEAALSSAWSGPGVWIHGDVTGSNLLLRDGRLSAVIDFGCTAVGDPACDLTAAWTIFQGASRDRFVDALALDAATWARARGWALWKALTAMLGTTPNDPAQNGTTFGWHRAAPAAVEEVILDFQERA